MTPTEALDQLIDTGSASSEAVGALYEAGLVTYDPFCKAMFRPNAAGKEALERRRKERTTASFRAESADRPDESVDPRE